MDSNLLYQMTKVVKMSHKEYRKSSGTVGILHLRKSGPPPTFILVPKCTWTSMSVWEFPCMGKLAPSRTETFTQILLYLSSQITLRCCWVLDLTGRCLLLVVLLHQNQMQGWSVACFKGLSQRKKVFVGNMDGSWPSAIGANLWVSVHDLLKRMS